jgi:hypothetical protein
MSPPASAPAPEYNVTGIDFAQRGHLRYAGRIIDLHAHVFQTRPEDPKDGPPLGKGPGASLDQAETMINVAKEFGIVRTYSMCPPDDIEPLRQKFGNHIGFNGPINKKLTDPDDTAYRSLDQFLALGVEMLKFWSAPRGRERGLLVDAPWRIESARRARAAGIRWIMVHVADPDTWFRTVYADAGKFGTKPEHYIGLERMLEEFPDIRWIGAHMGGDVEHPDHLEALLEKYPHFYLDTSATKWQVREVPPHREAICSLISRYSDRFFFGSDLVTHHNLDRDHYVSRYWCQRTLWESAWEGNSPIFDKDYQATAGGPTSPPLLGVDLAPDVVAKVYYDNACRWFPKCRLAA